ncbi:MAG: heparan-alpha-glucosaminide N-acetyltransferase domain-containing protein [Promethearchaeota archaeon]
MKRYKSVDAIRGLCMIIMIVGHLLHWWLTPADHWLYDLLKSIIGPLGASGFLFISGVSAELSYKKRRTQSKETDMKFLRNIYLFRALLLLIIAFIYNMAIAIVINDLTWIWAWFVLQTVGFSLLLAWPFLKTSKTFRIIIGTFVLIINYYFLWLLSPYNGQANIYGVCYHILFNPLELYPILPYFSIFIFGTVIGDKLHNINKINDQKERKIAFKKRFLVPLIIIGFILIVFSIIFYFPSFLLCYTFSAMVYSLGIIFVLLAILIWVEEFNLIKIVKSHRFFYFYSYYSFTIFLAHNPLYFLFLEKLNIITIWIGIFIALVFLTILLRFIYKKLGAKASLKILISVISFKIALKIEERKKIKQDYYLEEKEIFV